MGYIYTYIAKYKNILCVYSLHAFSNGESYTNYYWELVNYPKGMYILKHIN
jgi:hypothetical protein